MKDLFWIEIDLMFDFGISLFMLTTIAMYFNFSHASILSLFMLSRNQFIVCQ